MVAVIEAPEHQTLLMKKTFRAVLTALSEPLRAVSIPALPTPLGTTSALWAMALTHFGIKMSVCGGLRRTMITGTTPYFILGSRVRHRSSRRIG